MKYMKNQDIVLNVGDVVVYDDQDFDCDPVTIVLEVPRVSTCAHEKFVYGECDISKYALGVSYLELSLIKYVVDKDVYAA